MSPEQDAGRVLDGVVPWPPALAERWRALGYWRGETFGGMLRDRAIDHPDRLALVAGEDRWTYGELDARADRLAVGFRSIGVAPGDRVVVQLGNVAAFVEIVFGLFRIGALPVFALPPHRRTEIVSFCEQAEAVAYVIGARDGAFDPRTLAAEVQRDVPGLAHVVVAGDASTPPHALRPFVSLESVRAPAGATPAAEDAPQPSDVAFLQLSGGSTGVPKLIPRTHDEYLYTLRRSAEVCGLDGEGVYMATLPAAHNFPLSSPGIMGAFHAGSRVVLAPSPDPDTALGLIAAEGVTITGIVPPLALVWLDAVEAGTSTHDLSSLRVLQVGGAKFSAEAARRVRPVLGCTLQQVFGMAEGLVCYTGLDDDEETIVTTQGRPMAEHDEILAVDDDDEPVADGDVGSLLTRGPYTIQGYYRADEHNARAFTPDGWYRTGDLVRIRRDGRVVVEGRDKDQINRGGEKIAAEEVENHLLAHPAVHDAAVVAMPDPYLGERTCAFVVLREGASARAPELRRFVRERGLAEFKVPDRVELVDAFPRTNVGKVSKKDLRADIARRLEPADT
ncbi:(2,3-dihydroxybenzoyl)adenylate synthase [Patulibacter minatonensis]|uniref:(2,3-dihydroxybenzoyl)adenylate synthase n=1 Tax=Patulibacter minatonensis TaxID=298163 RepID=UPI00047B75E9|nr:(2,3-dihydroxybenzoyl)adenylate synthase [Patulibacter minatonensis]